MSLLSGLTPPIKKTACKVRTLLETLEPKDAEILVTALADQHLWPARTLQIALSQRKLIVSDVSIGRHRKGQCSCA
jgi:hypothetical protein